MNRQDIAVTKALKEIQGSLNLNGKQTAYLKTFLNCMYDLGKIEKVTKTNRQKPVEMLFGNIVIEEFETTTKAATKTKQGIDTIYKLLKSGQKNKNGYYFRYKYKDINTTWLK